MIRMLALILLFTSCAHRNPYENASDQEKAAYQEVIVPHPTGTKFSIGYSPFRGTNKMYSWAFNVPYGTPVLSIKDGVVVLTRSEGTKGGCGPENEGHGHLIRIQHDDGTVAQYLHLTVQVKEGEKVKKGQVIAKTALNGLVCAPHLHFMLYRNMDEARKGNNGATVPLKFTGINGLAIDGMEGTVP